MERARAHTPLPYDLRPRAGTGASYDVVVEDLAVETLRAIEQRGARSIDAYLRFIQDNDVEPPRSRGEYAIELLTLGVLWSRYLGASQHAPRGWIPVLTGLVRLRRRMPAVKPLLDPIRGVLLGAFLAPHVGAPARDARLSRRNLRRLLDWLAATGEHAEDERRLRGWERFLAGLPSWARQEILVTAFDAAAWFERRSRLWLGAFTREHQAFQDEQRLAAWFREDNLLRGRGEVEYHLDMVGAQVMSWALHDQYVAASRRIVILPGCMRRSNGVGCRARVEGSEITCSECTPSCHVARVSALGRRHDFEVRIVLHGSGFAEWLDGWKMHPEVGLVPAACLAHLLPGGYEVRARGLAAQCVPLSYPGCRAHWHEQGVATDVDDERLLRAVLGQAMPASSVVAIRRPA